MAAILSHNESLRSLDLQGTALQLSKLDTKVEDEGAKRLAAALECNQTLTALNLTCKSLNLRIWLIFSESGIEQEGAKAIAAALEQNVCLTSLELQGIPARPDRLQGNTITEVGAEALAIALAATKP